MLLLLNSNCIYAWSVRRPNIVRETIELAMSFTCGCWKECFFIGDCIVLFLWITLSNDLWFLSEQIRTCPLSGNTNFTWWVQMNDQQIGLRQERENVTQLRQGRQISENHLCQPSPSPHLPPKSKWTIKTSFFVVVSIHVSVCKKL